MQYSRLLLQQLKLLQPLPDIGLTEQSTFSKIHRSGPGITLRLVMALACASAIIFAVVFYVNYRYTALMVERQVRAHASDVVQAALNSIDDMLKSVARDEGRLVAHLEALPHLTPEIVRNIAKNHVVNNEEVFGATIAFEPQRSPAGTTLFAPYYYRRQNGSIAYADLSLASYNYLKKEWYLSPKELKTPIWTEPYFDEGGGNVLMTTFAAPFYRKDKGGARVFAGIATADISVAWLGAQVSSLRLQNNGYAALFSRSGQFIANPDSASVMKESLLKMAEKSGSKVLEEVGKGIARQESGFAKGNDVYGREIWIYYAPVPSTGWSLAVIFPAEKMMKDAADSSRVIAFICVGGFLFLLLTIILVARTVTRPLVAMTDAVEQISGGRLDVVLPETQGGEVGQLAVAFNCMQKDLQDYIKNLTETTASKERMARELAIAHDMQMSILPLRLPDAPTLDFAGLCKPAREVGGDFYDVRQMDDGRFFFIIGDVSGKGVPAALYMSMAVTLARSGVRDLPDPEELLSRVNRELCQGNETSMFVTILCGVIDPVDGVIQFANAGHTPPVIISADGEPSYLRLEPGLVAGCIDSFDYRSESITLKPGEILLMYTDGVTEAMDSAESLFGEERLLSAIPRRHLTARHLLESVDSAVSSFAGQTLQADDITMLAVLYKG